MYTRSARLSANRRYRDKRNQNVYDEDSDTNENMDFSGDSNASDLDCDMPKVRKAANVRSLLRNSEKFEYGEDHMYTKMIKEEQPSAETPRSINGRSNNVRIKRKVFRLEDNFELEPDRKKAKCSSKNAIMARLNRERKKQYVTGLEEENDKLKAENELLFEKNLKQRKLLDNLKYEVVYLKSLLSNSKEICTILGNISKQTGLPVTSSLISVSKDNGIGENKRHSSVSSSHREDGYSSGTDSEVHNTKTETNGHGNVNTTSNFARTKCVTSGSNFPIAFNDVSLGLLPQSDSKLDQLDDFNDFKLEDLESPLFNFETDFNVEELYADSINLDLSPVHNDTLIFDNHSSDIKPTSVSGVLPDVGVCLHINKKRVSLELCSLCHRRASNLESC